MSSLIFFPKPRNGADMKEKIKKLWQEKKDDIIDYAILGGGLVAIVTVASGISWLEATRRANDKNQITGGDVYMNLSGGKNQSIIIVNHKNKTQTKLESNGDGIFDVLERRWLQLEQARASATEE